MERPRSMPRYSASRFAGMAAAAHDGSASSRAAAAATAERGEDAEAAPLSTTSSAKRTRFLLPRRAFSRFFRFSARRAGTESVVVVSDPRTNARSVEARESQGGSGAALGLPDEERQGRRRGDGAPAASEAETSCGCLARQRE